LIVVDNGSNDGTVEYLESISFRNYADERIKIIKNNENKGFAGGNNLGIAASIGDYIIIMNNDVVVTPGWLERMISCCEKRPEIGIVGPRSNYVSGPQLLEPVDYNLDSLLGLKRFSEKFATINAKKSTQLLRVVGFCMLIKRSVIDKIGGLDDRFGIGNFEDDDFSLRAALAGFESWMAEDCFVHHFGSRTFVGEKIDYRESLLRNWEIFKKKWGLPKDLPYGNSYSLSQMSVKHFDLKKHFITLEKATEEFPKESHPTRPKFDHSDKNDEIMATGKRGHISTRTYINEDIEYSEEGLRHNDHGVKHLQEGEEQKALESYRKAVSLAPGNTIFRKNLADLLAVSFGEFEEALQHYVAVLVSDPRDVEALSATGHICARLERYDDAAEFYVRVLEIEPNNSDAIYWLDNMREKESINGLDANLNDRYQTLLSEIDQGNLAGAIHKIDNFIKIYPTHGQAHNDLGVFCYKNGDKTNVLACYLKAVELEPENVTFRKNLADFLYVEEGRVEEALENYVEVLRIKPDDADTLLIAGHICTTIERFEDAMIFYHKVLDIEPRNLDARQNLEALKNRQISMLNQEARSEKKPGDNAEIIQAEPHASHDDVPIIRTSVVEDFIKRADLLFQQERIDQAVDIFLKAIAVNPLHGSTYIELAWQLVNHGRHENALEVLSEMPENQPEALVMKKFLLEGYSHGGMGNYAAAKRCVDWVQKRQPENAQSQNLLGILAYQNGDAEKAEKHFKRAIELNPEYGEPHTNLGVIVWENGASKMALEYYERGFSISPTDIDVANAYHEAVSAAGEYKRAEKVARRALKKYPQCRKVHYLLIDTLIRQEKTEEALKELETALSTFGIDEGLLDTALAFRNRVGKNKKTGSTKKPGVSLCMIVKDEEDNLARCLASIKPIVDEMVVVDTGSTDRTRDIAEFFGARVYDFEWINDFAAARNFSISKAKGDWTLIMDADEVISSKDYDHFRKLTAKKSEEPVAYSVATRNYCHEANTIGWYPNDGHYVQEEAGFGWLLSEKVRLFSNKNEIKFEGAVHEMVDPVLKRIGIKIKKSAIPVHHYGRLNTDLLNKKRRIYYEIGQKKLAENGRSIGAVRELAIQATALEKNSEAIKLWKKFLSMKPDSRSVPEAYVNMGSAYIRMKDYEKALISAQKAVAIRPEMKEAQYNLGMAELYNGNADAAVMTLKRLIKSYPNFPPAQFLLAASNCCKNNSPDRNGELKALKRSSFGGVLTYSVAELAAGLMTADQHKFALKLLLRAIEEEIVSKDIMNLYAACIKKNEDSRNLEGKIPEEADVLQETIVD
jgi:tetratricopeptide (TPR) repeat protein